jgi:hypothetical protein
MKSWTLSKLKLIKLKGNQPIRNIFEMENFDPFTDSLLVKNSKTIQKSIQEIHKNKFIDSPNRHLRISSDSRTVSHVDASTLQTDASIQSVHPLSTSTRVAYFELKVTEIKGNGMVAIGIGYNKFPNSKQPGWVENSYGYHSDDGKKFNNTSVSTGTVSGISYGPSYGENDIVGCGIIWRTKEIFFTKNGRNLGKAFDFNGKKTPYAVIGMDHSSATINFGPRFQFDVTSMEFLETQKEGEQIQSRTIDSEFIRNLVKSHLIKQGYKETLANFEKTTTNDYQLTSRSQIRNLILQGKMESVIQMLSDSNSDFLKVVPTIHVLMCLQLFIEYVRNDKISESLEFARKSLADCKFVTNPPLHDVLGLLAYDKPLDCPLKHLFEMKQREYVAQEVNNALLVHFGGNATSNLEYSLKQLIHVYTTVRVSPKKDNL